MEGEGRGMEWLRMGTVVYSDREGCEGGNVWVDV